MLAKLSIRFGDRGMLFTIQQYLPTSYFNPIKFYLKTENLESGLMRLYLKIFPLNLCLPKVIIQCLGGLPYIFDLYHFGILPVADDTCFSRRSSNCSAKLSKLKNRINNEDIF